MLIFIEGADKLKLSIMWLWHTTLKYKILFWNKSGNFVVVFLHLNLDNSDKIISSNSVLLH